MIQAVHYLICDQCKQRLAEVVSAYALLPQPGVLLGFTRTDLLLTCPRCAAVTSWKIKTPPAVSELSETGT